MGIVRQLWAGSGHNWSVLWGRTLHGYSLTALGRVRP